MKLAKVFYSQLLLSS